MLKNAKEFKVAVENGLIDRTSGMNQVCKLMKSVMSYCVTLPYHAERSLIKRVNKLGLFPLERQASLNDEILMSEMEKDKRKLAELKMFCYTKEGYRKLKWFRKWVKIKHRLFFINNKNSS